MSHSNGIISEPINFSDPYIVTGTGKYNGGYDVGYICSNAHGRTVMWAKNKPMRNSKMEDLTNEEKRIGKYGLLIPESSLNGAYQYLPPRGGDSEPYRITDWIGYNHNSPCFIRVDFPEHMYLNQWNTINVWLDSRASGNFNDKTISILDLFHDTDYYISLVVQGAEGRVVVLTDPTPVKTLCGENGQKLVTFNVGNSDFTDMHTTAKFYVVANSSNSTDYNINTMHSLEAVPGLSWREYSLEKYEEPKLKLISGKFDYYVDDTEYEFYARGCTLVLDSPYTVDRQVSFVCKANVSYDNMEGGGGYEMFGGVFTVKPGRNTVTIASTPVDYSIRLDSSGTDIDMYVNYSISQSPEYHEYFYREFYRYE